ncbi:unnamed protein product [Echinostoma caproni]|uniref:NADH dehydrogenase [ubiquinone] 1 alpha subcomplex subunit 1 n=1 Tax=Echinostoma caproni TaxID=27848 RepID=A0A183AR15_9TREM|nr:unnamed protein product [Echinostoma caproni]
MKSYRLALPYKWMEYPVNAIRFLITHPAIGLVMTVTAIGCGTMLRHAIRCAFIIPEGHLRYESMPRNEYYFRKRWYPPYEHQKMVPPVRMHCDGSLEFPYDEEESYVRRDEPCNRRQSA